MIAQLLILCCKVSSSVGKCHKSAYLRSTTVCVCVCGTARKDDSRSDYSHTWLNHTQRRHTSQAITVLFPARQGKREKRKHNWQLPTVDSGSVATTCASQATEAGHTNEKKGNGGQPETDHHHHNCNKYNDNHDQQHLHPLQTIEQYLTDVTHRS